MAPRPKSKQRLRGVLRVYQRPMRGGALWWWCAVGRARHALGLDASTTRDEAYRVACERHGAGALTARGPGAAPEATLVEILATYRAEQEARYKPRAWQSKRYILAAFVTLHDSTTSNAESARHGSSPSLIWITTAHPIFRKPSICSSVKPSTL